MTSPRPKILFQDDDLGGLFDIGEDGIPVLRQEINVPKGAFPVRMQTADLPVTVIGWVTDASAIPGLLRDVANELEKVLDGRDKTPG